MENSAVRRIKRSINIYNDMKLVELLIAGIVILVSVVYVIGYTFRWSYRPAASMFLYKLGVFSMYIFPSLLTASLFYLMFSWYPIYRENKSIGVFLYSYRNKNDGMLIEHLSIKLTSLVLMIIGEERVNNIIDRKTASKLLSVNELKKRISILNNEEDRELILKTVVDINKSAVSICTNLLNRCPANGFTNAIYGLIQDSHYAEEYIIVHAKELNMKYFIEKAYKFYLYQRLIDKYIRIYKLDRIYFSKKEWEYLQKLKQ